MIYWLLYFCWHRRLFLVLPARLPVLTDFSMGLVKLIPVSIHELVEFMVAVAVIILAYTLFNNNADGKLYYVILGNCLLLTWLVTDYKGDSVHSLAKL
jgi:hypothetical protein